MGIELPDAVPVQVEANDFNDRPSRDFQPDTVITVGPRQKPVHGIIVEAQQEKSEGKRRQLPRYAAALWLFLDCPVTVLCVCPDPGVAAYYAESFPTKLPGYTFQAVVFGPDRVPVITDSAEAAAHPELAAMAVMMHGSQAPVLQAFVAALLSLTSEYAEYYYGHAYNMAAPAVRRILEELVSKTWPVNTPFAREHFGRGKTEGEVDALLTMLEARRIELPESARARICASTDIEEIKAWIKRAAVASSIDELFAGGQER
ncbi:hypothetical protein [Actinoallomurus sp. CA-150999]|uniref:hypothetical protein n=1 Tax=Actinoallomurus sp. CA-150999 TaxID=3239887 RepID=UPI003D8C9859